MGLGYWSKGTKLAHIVLASACGTAALGFYLTWDDAPRAAVIPGTTLSLTRTIDVALKSPRNTYWRFSPGDVDSALVGGQVRVTSGVTARIVGLTADTGRIRERHGRYSDHTYPGLHVQLSAEIEAVNRRGSGHDTVWLQLPGILRLGARVGDSALVVQSFQRPIDSAIIKVLTHYPSAAAVRVARLPWLFASVACALLFVSIGVHALLKTFSRDNAP